MSSNNRTVDSIINAKNPKFDREEIIYFCECGFTVKQIADIMGCSIALVSIVLDGAELYKNPSRPKSCKNFEELAFLKLYERGLSDYEISNILNCGREHVRDQRTTRGLSANYPAPNKPTPIEEVAVAIKPEVVDDPKIEEEPTEPATVEGFKAPVGYILVPEPKSERVQLLVQPSIKEAVSTEAVEKGVSFNEMASRIFRSYLNSKGENHE